MRYAVIFEQGKTNWSAYVPDLPGCVTTGKTLEETRGLMAEAIEFHMEGLKRHGYPAPAPSTVAESVEVQRPVTRGVARTARSKAQPRI